MLELQGMHGFHDNYVKLLSHHIQLLRSGGTAAAAAYTSGMTPRHVQHRSALGRPLQRNAAGTHSPAHAGKWHVVIMRVILSVLLALLLLWAGRTQQSVLHAHHAKHTALQPTHTSLTQYRTLPEELSSGQRTVTVSL